MTDKKIVVFDIDGTLADIEHRRGYVQTKPKNWPAFNAAMVHDAAHGDIVWLFKTLLHSGDCTMLLASGRGEEFRQHTVEWLEKHGVVYERLYMRPAKDSRSDVIIKAEILEEIRKDFGEPYMVFDDRNGVVDGWRANGIRCCQVAPGDF